MAIYYKFLSAKDYNTIHMDGAFISVGSLKREILESKYKATKATDDSRTNRHHPNGLCLGTDLDLLVFNAQTMEEYVDDSALIPRNTSVLLRRAPGNRHRKPIDTTPIVPEPREQPMEEKSFASGSSGSGSSVVTDMGDDFGEDVFAIPGAVLVQSNKPSAVAVGGKEKEDEDSKIRALVSTPALDYYDSDISSQAVGGFRQMGGRGFGGLEGRTPPEGYVCHRCNVPGHFIQHCPTNGDPKHDFRRVRPPTGIPKSMLVVNPDGSYKLPEGACAVIKPNENAFDKEMEGLFPSCYGSARSIPLTLYCPLCKQVMKDAMVTSKCCFQSFCDKCIRDWLINSKLKCVCGTSNVLTDYLLPNITLRDAIKRILECGSCSSSGENVTSAFRVQEIESAGYQKENVPAPLQSAASTKGGKRSSPAVGNSDHIAKKLRSTEASDVSKAQSGSVHGKEPALGKDVPVCKEEVQQKAAPSETGKQRRKKKASQGEAAESYMMPMDSYAYDSYWNVMQPWMQVYMAPCANTLPYNAYGMNSYGVPFFSAPSYMPPSRDF